MSVLQEKNKMKAISSTERNVSLNRNVSFQGTALQDIVSILLQQL